MNDILAAINVYEYTKAKFLFINFLRKTLCTLIEQNPNSDITQFKSTSNAIFFLLGSKSSITPEDEIDYINKLDILKDIAPVVINESLSLNNLIHFRDKIGAYHFTWNEYNDLLIFLHENLLKYIDCNFFNDSKGLEKYTYGKTSIVDALIACRFGPKLEYILNVYNALKDIGDTVEPIKVIGTIKDLLRVTKVNNLRELLYTVTKFSEKKNEELDPSNMVVEDGGNAVENKLDKFETGTEHVKEVIFDIINNLLEIKITGFETNTQIVAKVKKALEEHCKRELHTLSETQATKADLETNLSKNKYYENYIAEIEGLFITTDWKNILIEIRSMLDFFNKIYETYEISDKTELLQLLINQSKTINTLQSTRAISNENMTKTIENINYVLKLNNNYSTTSFVDDFKGLHDTFHNTTLTPTKFSLKQVGLLLENSKSTHSKLLKVSNELKKQIKINEKLQQSLQPLTDLENIIDIPAIVDFMKAVLSLRHSASTTVKSHLKTCLQRINQYPRLELEHKELKDVENQLELCESEMKQLTIFQEELKYCKQRLTEYESEILELKKENEQYIEAIKSATYFIQESA